LHHHRDSSSHPVPDPESDCGRLDRNRQSEPIVFDQTVARDSDATTDLLLASFLALTFARRSAFGGSLFPAALRMNAEIAP